MSRTLILGHRGAPCDAPENTMRAFRLAMEQGADGIELDVQPSADGAPVILHDDTLDRTTDARGDVRLLPWSTIAAARSHGEPVPRLDEVVAWAREAGAFLNIELKRPGIERTAIELVDAAGLIERTIFSSFHEQSVAVVRKVAPDATCYLLTDRWGPPVLELARDLGVGGVCLNVRLATPAALSQLRDAGLQAVVWTVDRPARIRELVRAGVQAVITNRPALAVVIRDEVSGGER
jgi:glycerophosphoryl diester phosphodiesterase